MSGVFSQLYIQFIFAVGNKDCLISRDWENELYKHISAFLRNEGHVPIIIKGSHDHIHIFAVITPDKALTDVAEAIKSDSQKFINDSGFLKTAFSWQSGMGAFTYSKTRTNDVYLYIQSQDRYHSKRTFREEFIEFLRLYNIDYDTTQLPLGLEEFTMVLDQ